MTVLQLFALPIEFASLALIIAGSTMALGHRRFPFGALIGNGMAISGWAGLMRTADWPWWVVVPVGAAAIFWNVRQVHNLRGRI